MAVPRSTSRSRTRDRFPATPSTSTWRAPCGWSRASGGLLRSAPSFDDLQALAVAEARGGRRKLESGQASTHLGPAPAVFEKLQRRPQGDSPSGEDGW